MEVCLHLGAHKTATTYIQTLLLHSIGNLRAAGVDFVPLAQLRNTLTPALMRAARPGIGGFLQQRTVDRILQDLLDRAEERGARRLVLSEENLLGTCGEVIFDGEFYPRAWAILEQLGRRLEDRPVRVFLSVRSYAEYFVSAYGQVLRQNRYLPFDERLRQRMLSLRRGWANIVSDVRAAFPYARLRVWTYEDLREVEAMILAEMLGADAASGLCAFDERPMTGLSAAAMTAIERANGIPDQRLIASAFRDHPKSRGAPKFNPWSASEQAELALRYRRDLETLHDAFPGALFSACEDA